MTHELITNRYNQVSPTHIQSNGCSVSTPIYITPTTDQLKALLNAFREVVRDERQIMGYEPTKAVNGVVVTNHVKPANTPSEDAIGMTEESLRYALFQRKGLPDRLIFKLQELTGLELVSRSVVLKTVETWLDHMNLNEKQTTKRTNKASKTSKKTTVSTDISA